MANVGMASIIKSEATVMYVQYCIFQLLFRRGGETLPPFTILLLIIQLQFQLKRPFVPSKK